MGNKCIIPLIRRKVDKKKELPPINTSKVISIPQIENIEVVFSDELPLNTEDNREIDNRLLTLNPLKVKKYTLAGLKTRVRVSRVIDGDTIVIIFFTRDDFKEPREAHVRLYGLDTPELHPRLNSLHHDQEKQAGIEAKSEMIQIVRNNNELLTMKVSGEDKYGRILAKLEGKEGDISEYMIKNKFGIFYDGKKKKAFEDWYYESHPTITRPLIKENKTKENHIKICIKDKVALKEENNEDIKIICSSNKTCLQFLEDGVEHLTFEDSDD